MRERWGVDPMRQSCWAWNCAKKVQSKVCGRARAVSLSGAPIRPPEQEVEEEEDAENCLRVARAAVGSCVAAAERQMLLLRSPDPGVRRRAVDALYCMGSAAAPHANVLAEAAEHDPDKEVRVAASRAVE